MSLFAFRSDAVHDGPTLTDDLDAAQAYAPAALDAHDGKGKSAVSHLESFADMNGAFSSTKLKMDDGRKVQALTMTLKPLNR